MKKNNIVLVFIIILIILLIILVVGIVAIKNITKQNEEIPVEDRPEGGAKYDRKQLINVAINIQGITDEIKTYINDIDEFNLNFKEYIYLNGLVDAENAVVEQWRVVENNLQIIFKLDDINNTILKVNLDITTNEIVIMENNT